MNKDKGQYCKHIESRLPKLNKQSVKAYASERIEEYPLRATALVGLTDIDVSEQLTNYGLDPYEVELLMLRFIDGKSMKEIVKEQGWVNLNSANHYLRVILKKLRDGNFKFR